MPVIHNEKVLYMWLMKILEEGREPNKSERLRTLAVIGFEDKKVARNILEYLKKASVS